MSRLTFIFENVRNSKVGVWYAEKSVTDRRVILAIGILCLTSAIYIGGWKPLIEYRETQSSRFDRAQTLVDWTILNRQELLASNRNKSPFSTQKSLLPLVTASAKQMQLKLNRLQPEQDGSVSVTLQSQSFDRALAWIVDLESNQGLLIDRISVDRTVNVGLVNIQLRIQ